MKYAENQMRHLRPRQHGATGKGGAVPGRAEGTLTDYAVSHGYEIVDYYADKSLTARKKMQNRKDLMRLLRDVEADKVDLILVTKLDRWFRNIKDYHNTQAILEAHNCNWKTIFEAYDTSTANGRFAINIIFALYELVQAVKEVGSEDAAETLETLVQGKRLKDISDLPLDLAV